MNRLAVVLAADSATTVSRWTDSGEEKRYFKGANKIFQLSHHHSVGMMIFDSADLLQVPWEVIAKEFRKELGDKSFDHVDDYADAFFSFLDSNLMLFPLDVRWKSFIAGARSAALQYIFGLDKRFDPTAANPQQFIVNDLAAHHAAVLNKPLPACIDAQKVTTAKAGCQNDVLALLQQTLPSLQSLLTNAAVTQHVNVNAWTDAAIDDVFRRPDAYLGTTGIVFAGFGDKDVFPRMIEFQSCSYVGPDHVEYRKEEMTIDHEHPAWLSAFAQTSMSETFRMGVSRSVYVSLIEAVREGMNNLAAEVSTAFGQAGPVPNGDKLIADTVQRVETTVLKRATEENAAPMQRVIAVLPIDEMASLAETLINLQSLKEKVTAPSESVGGPVDVAVITRAEGLVWIKRKHFFPGELNSRFQQRQSALYKKP